MAPKFLLLDGSLVLETHKEDLNLISLLTTRYKTEHIFHHLKYEALISIGHIFDDGCTATLIATHLNGSPGRWKVNLSDNSHTNPTPPRSSANNIL